MELQASNYIFKLTIDEDTKQLHAVKKAVIQKVNTETDIDRCYLISSNEDIAILENVISHLFHQRYFKLNQSPVVLFSDESLFKPFKKLIANLGLGSIENLLYNQNSKEIFWINNHTDFYLLFDSEFNGQKYFVSKDETIFNTWTKELSQIEQNSIVKNYYIQIDNQKKASQLVALNNELELLKESLSAIKTEYSKELEWYKKEIENIKDWYKKEHDKTPALITKLFKKIF